MARSPASTIAGGSRRAKYSRHRIDLKIDREGFRIDLQKLAECTADSVIDEHFW